MKKQMNNNRLLLPVMIFSLLCSFNVTGNSELSRLRRDNSELRTEIIAMEKELSFYRQWLAGIAVDHGNMSASGRERRALNALDELSRRGNVLTLAAAAVNDEIKQVWNFIDIDPVKKARLQLRIDELEKAVFRFTALSIPGDDSIKKCRILAVNRELDIIVLSAGTNSGIAPGMVFYADNDSGIRLRVIGVRVEGAAAELLSGEWKDVIPGMSVSALKVEKSESKGK